MQSLRPITFGTLGPAALALLLATAPALAQTPCAGNIVRAGDADGYLNTTSPLDVVSMRPAFEAWINQPGGNNATYHGGQSLRFDTQGTSNWEFGHSFTSLPQLTGATLTIGVRSTSSSGNDRINLQFDETSETFSWSSQFGPLESLVGGDGTWSQGDSMTVTLDLAALPSGALTNLIPTLNAAGHLDVRISDDTDIDFVELSYCEATQAGPSLDGNPHWMLGSATASATPDMLTVRNIGTTGTDGVEFTAPPITGPAKSLSVGLTGVGALPPGGSLTLSAKGTQNGVPMLHSTFQATGVAGGGIQYAASFPATAGWGLQKVQVLHQGSVVYEGVSNAPTLNVDGAPTEPCDFEVSWVDHESEGPGGILYNPCSEAYFYVEHVYASGPAAILGDQVRFLPLDGPALDGPLESVAIRAQDIPTFTVLSESTLSPFTAAENLGGGATPACGAGCSSMELVTTGGASLAGNSNFGFEVVGTPDAGYVGLWLGFGPPTAGIPLAGGTLYASLVTGMKWGSITSVLGVDGCSGSAAFPLPLPNSTNLIGAELTPQGFFICPAGEAALTNALAIRIQ